MNNPSVSVLDRFKMAFPEADYEDIEVIIWGEKIQIDWYKPFRDSDAPLTYDVHIDRESGEFSFSEA